MVDKFYAVKKGKIPGVYRTWEECEAQVRSFCGAIYKLFKDEESARDFVNGTERRYDVKEGSVTAWNKGSFWHKTGHELAKELISDAESHGGLTEKRYLDVNLNADSKHTVSKESPQYRFNAWISGSHYGMGVIAVWFGQNDPKNYTGISNWKGPIEKTRIRLAAVIRAISITLQYIRDEKLDSSQASLIIHSESKYLIRAVTELFKTWPSIPENKNTDILRFLQKQLTSTKMRMNCVLDIENAEPVKTMIDIFESSK